MKRAEADILRQTAGTDLELGPAHSTFHKMTAVNRWGGAAGFAGPGMASRSSLSTRSYARSGPRVSAKPSRCRSDAVVKRARSFSRSAKGPETLSDNGTSQIGPIVVALEIDDVELANHLAALLAGVAGLRLAARGELSDVIITDAPSKAEQADIDPILTTRETEVLTLLSEGASNKEIARRLNISVHTAKFHVGQILDKLDATGRTEP